MSHKLARSWRIARENKPNAKRRHKEQRNESEYINFHLYRPNNPLIFFPHHGASAHHELPDCHDDHGNKPDNSDASEGENQLEKSPITLIIKPHQTDLHTWLDRPVDDFRRNPVSTSCPLAFNSATRGRMLNTDSCSASATSSAVACRPA
jgi:hypothetical protein